MNKIYIFDEVKKVTARYHERGGLVVIARDLKAAKALVAANKEIEVDNWEKAVEGNTDLTERLFVFPDAGCC